MIYRLAALTGLRAQELASLTPESFALDATPPTVTVAAGYSKRRRRDVLPLHADLVERLRPFLAKKKPQVRLWPGLWYRRGAGSVKRDLALARKDWIAEATSDAERKRREKCDFLAYRDRQGRVADFHALRHGFITYLVSGNVPPKVAQMLARHSTITLTMDRYTHLGMDDMARALGKLPGV